MDQHFIEEVRNSVSIVQVLSEYVTLKKAGKDHSALCPFHSEKTPSFYVSESKKIFKCFGCGVSGDVFKFLEMIEGLSFPEALKSVAQRAGIPVPERSQAPAQAREKEGLYTIMERAAQFYQQQLRENAGAVLDYLQNRGIGEDGVGKFRLGYAPRSGNVLLKHLKKEGFHESEIDLCGLLKASDGGLFHDKFRGRVIVPIADLSGRVIALGGRVIGDGMPKYLNSPETPIYHKGSNLFGLNLSKEQIRQKDFAILVEGYFDLIVPYLNGVRSVVASLGTSLTLNQVKLVGRYTRNIIVNYDPDSAGVAATRRSIDLFLQEGFRVSVVSLPDGMDPDSFIRKEGVEAYVGKLRSARRYFDFLLESAIKDEKAPHTPKGKVNILNGLIPYVALLPNKIERAEMVSRLAERLRLDNSLILSELRKVAVERKRDVRLKIPIEQEVTKTEQRLLKLLSESKEARNEILPLLQPDDFKGLATESIFKLLQDFHHRNEEVTFLRVQDALGSDDEKQFFSRIVLASSSDPELDRGDALNCLNALRRLRLQHAREELQSRIEEAEKNQRPEEIDRLYREKLEVTRQLQLLP
ncbi:MAG TPA: DNA primase [Acidobacteriota bacterium]|jgi:DNA primase|nr:DNA primase [Acidobacteriota bacterium]